MGKVLKCENCGERKNLTRHHTYNPLDPLEIIPLCRECHDKVHNMRPKTKYNKKFQAGTRKNKIITKLGR